MYANEPVTRGKVVVHTSIGPLDIELWPKEAPMACRNFVQLCLEGYYDGCIFHRVIRDFMAQTGDPTGTGKGGESVFGSKFKDEFHSRLRFTHRGLIAMASEGPDTNGSQFFVTLDRCEWLDRKHTIFGKVTGNSLYNLHRFNELEVDAADRPEFAPRIERCEVLLEPFDDIVPRSPAATTTTTTAVRRGFPNTIGLRQRWGPSAGTSSPRPLLRLRGAQPAAAVVVGGNGAGRVELKTRTRTRTRTTRGREAPR